jgi:sarcosine oxidase
LAVSVRECDVVVIGAGVIGLAVTDALVRRGVEVRCLETGQPGRAQSSGFTRIFRHHHDDARLVQLAVRARASWRRWEDRSSRRLLGSEGALFVGANADDAERLAAEGVPHRFVQETEQRDLLAVAAPVDAPVLFDEHAGALRARRVIETLFAWVGDRLESTEVLGVTVPTGGRPQLQTTDGLYRAAHVVLCAGAGTAGLAAGVGMNLPVSYGMHARPCFAVRRSACDGPLASWIDRSGLNGDPVYGAAVGTSGRYVVGLAGADADLPLGKGVSPPPGTDMTEHVRRVIAYVRRVLPGLDPEPESLRLCLATALPGGRDAFQAWQREGVTALAGHNMFKFAPVIGELIADAVQDGIPEPLRLMSDAISAAP